MLEAIKKNIVKYELLELYKYTINSIEHIHRYLLNNKTVLVLDKPNKNIFLSSRNLSKAKVVLASELNTYDIMNANKMLFIESSIKEIEQNF